MTRKRDLKKRIKFLESDLIELVTNPLSFRSMGIKARIRILVDLEKAICNRSVEPPETFKRFNVIS